MPSFYLGWKGLLCPSNSILINKTNNKNGSFQQHRIIIKSLDWLWPFHPACPSSRGILFENNAMHQSGNEWVTLKSNLYPLRFKPISSNY